MRQFSEPLPDRFQEVGGPISAAFQARKTAAIARGESNSMPVYVDRASGSEMWDVDGRRYVDFGTGIAVCNTGHLHPKVVQAVRQQLERFSHTCIMVTPYENAVAFAEQLNLIAPGPTRKKTMFVTTGAEAVENAVKIARAHTGRHGVISFDGGYHGRTFFALGLTGKMLPYKSGFGPFPAGIFRASFPIAYHGISVEQSLAALDNIFKTDVSPKECAAIIVEPVQGEGGFYPAPDEFLVALREICDRHGILLIADEIQSGFARTGQMFASGYAGIEPDLITIAKGMGGGFPIAGVVGKDFIMDVVAPGGLGGTYAGSPIACAAGLAVLDIIASENLAERALHIARQFDSRLKGLQACHSDRIGDIRTNRGAMIAVEIVREGSANNPDAEFTKNLAAKCHANGLVLLTCGTRGNVVRFLPALTIDDKILSEGIDIFTNCFEQLCERGELA